MVLRSRYLLAKGWTLMNLNIFIQFTTSLQIWYMQKLDHARDKYSHCVLLLSSSIINTWPIETKSAIMVPPTGVKANEILVGWELRTWWDFHRSKTQKKTELFSQGLFFISYLKLCCLSLCKSDLNSLAQIICQNLYQ